MYISKVKKEKFFVKSIAKRGGKERKS